MTIHHFAIQLGYAQEASDCLYEALTHRTFAHESKTQIKDNQRLEFLGDAVIGLSTAHHLMSTYPNDTEGQLSHRRAQLINARTLAQCADDLGVDQLLRIGKGEINMGEAAKVARLADAFEAIVGALYLDLGFNHAQQWVWKILQQYQVQVSSSDIDSHLTPKTQLQQWAHQHHLPSPIYVHTPRTKLDESFVVLVKIDSYEGKLGKGKSKKLAEQNAAALTLISINNQTLKIPIQSKQVSKKSNKKYNIKKNENKRSKRKKDLFTKIKKSK